MKDYLFIYYTFLHCNSIYKQEKMMVIHLMIFNKAWNNLTHH